MIKTKHHFFKDIHAKSHLVSIHSLNQFREVYTIVEKNMIIKNASKKQTNELTFWLGGKKNKATGNWSWEDGTTWSWSSWLEVRHEQEVSMKIGLNQITERLLQCKE